MFVGVDVGGTNTDAVLMDGSDLAAAVKLPTTADVTSGIVSSLTELLKHLPAQGRVDAVMVGTTHFTNALLERRNLAPTAVLRLSLPATQLLPPLVDWPDDLRQSIGGEARMVRGGHEFDGREISSLDRDAIRAAVKDLRKQGVRALALSGVFSPVNNSHELEAAEIVGEEAPEMRVCLSHENGRMGLLERENAATLNACLGEMASRTLSSIEEALASLGIDAPLYLSQNDGTLMDAEFAGRFPVLTISSGPTNSMRGAAWLSGVADGIVVDVGGTSTDVGALVNGFPREAAVAVQLAGVRTNFRMPDMVSIPLGGGTIVEPEAMRIGPESVGYRLPVEALVFGGRTLTATDLAVADGRAEVGDPRLVASLDSSFVAEAMAEGPAARGNRCRPRKAEARGCPGRARGRRKRPAGGQAGRRFPGVASPARRCGQRHRGRHSPGWRPGGASLLAGPDRPRPGDTRLLRSRCSQGGFGRGQPVDHRDRGGRRSPAGLCAQQRHPRPGQGRRQPGGSGLGRACKVQARQNQPAKLEPE